MARHENDELGEHGRKRLEEALAYTRHLLAPKMTPSTTDNPEVRNRPDPCPNLVVHQSPSAGTTLFRRVAHPESDGSVATSLYVRLGEPPAEIDESKALLQLGQRTVQHIKRTATKREQAFLSLLRPGSRYHVDLWVDATRYTWPTAALIQSGLKHLIEDVKAAFPTVKPTVEINAASDVIQDLNCGFWPADAQPSTSSAGQQIGNMSYIDARNAVFNLLKQGLVFSDAPDPSRTQELRLPDELLKQRTLSFRETLPDDWRNLTIRGAAGSGKTNTARWLAHRWAAEKTAVVAELRTHDLPSTQRSDDDTFSFDLFSVLKGVLERRFSERSLEPANPFVRRACADLAVKLLLDRSTPTIFIADNLDSFQELRDRVLKAVRLLHTVPFDVRIVRIFRSSSRDDGDTAPGAYVLELPLFTTADGKTVLSANAAATAGPDAETVDRLVARTPFASSEGVSLYGLRLINEWLQGSGQEKPRDVLLRIIERIIGPIATKMRQTIPYDDLKSALERVRDLVDQPDIQTTELKSAIPDFGHIDLIGLLGDLAWYSNYREQTPLTPLSVKKWSSGSIEDEHQADELLRQGEEAAIFAGRGNDRWWADQLVADGCAVMRLRTIDDDGLVAEMAAKLVENNASEMLWMASDYDTFRRIIDAVADRKQQLDALDAILSGASIAWLARDPKTLQGICHRLLLLGRGLETLSQRAHLSRLVWRLAQKDPDFLKALTDTARVDGTALCTMARELPPKQFQTEFADLGGAAIKAVAWIWPENEGLRLARWCSSLGGVDDATVSTAFSDWCNRQSHRTLIDVLEHLVGKDWSSRPHRWPIVGAAARAIAHPHLPDTDKLGAINVVKAVLRARPEEVTGDVALALFKLLDLDQEFMAADQCWVVHPSRPILVPTSPLGPSDLKTIISQIAKGGVWIASTKDLAGCSGLSFAGNELAGDDLKRRFVERAQENGMADPSELRVWDGERTEIRGAPRKFPMRWRPKVDIRDR